MQEFISGFVHDPILLFVVSCIVAVVVWLLTSRQYKPMKEKPLSTQQQEERLTAWRPKPIVPESYKPEIHSIIEPIIVKSATGAIITDEHGKDFLNFASTNFLGLAQLDELKQVAANTIKDYGVGSCGPRGFYGTIDLHLQLEKTFANFMSSPDSILYSDGLACLSSVIPAFCKNADYIFVDTQANCGIQQGLKLSRSKVFKYKHGDMASLEQALEKNEKALTQQEKITYRRFIVVEGISSKTGQLCPLDKVVQLAKKFKVRVLLDDSNAIGVLGKTGRGSLEHYNLQISKDVEILCATMDASMGSVGGLCVGSRQVVTHQRLSGSGYCFSAASPPYTAKVAATSLGLIDANPHLITLLQSKTSYAYATLTSKLTSVGYEVLGNALSPIIVIRPAASGYDKWLDRTEKQSTAVSHYNKVPGTDDEFFIKLKKIVSQIRDQHHIILSLQYHAPQEEPYPHGIRLAITNLHSEEDIELTANLIAQVTNNILSNTPTSSEFPLH